ncbi:predicted protein [Histoplasma capsulatum G186AR]|uniref:Uncharacterized protein n=1 Tax=Ajellomyces capsulatus (strain G186AR / H82 / ATCC MYA-2454 / RMSCC 2432) TaxID=447093 RepID=C0NUN1_AJECG|nr:uncharacterized protein HCBG_07062 [Histoplasma capsulatum G186AR]EEH05111.1 predicted protein [Histoplasma capsulatum G186AR]
MWASSHSRHAFKRLLNFERNSMFGIPLTATKHTSQSFWHIPRDPLASEEDIRGKFPGNSNIGFSILKILIFQVLGSRLVQVRFPETVGIQTFGGNLRVQLSHGLNYRKCANRVKNNSHKGIFSEASKQRAALAQRHFRRSGERADVTRKDPPNIWNLALTSGLTSKTRIRKKDGTWRGTW